MFLTRAAFVLLLQAHIILCLSESKFHGGGDCLDFADVALVVDVSGSIEGDGKFKGRFNKFVKPFLREFSERLYSPKGKVRIAMASFGNEGIVEFGLTSDIIEVIRNIDRFDYNSRGKNTNTSGGINVMRTQVLSPRDPNYRPWTVHVAVVVTDGISTYDHDLTIPSAKAAQNAGIEMLVVGVTDSLDLKELTGMASRPETVDISSLQNGVTYGVFTTSGTVAYVPEMADLNTVANQLVTHFKKTVCTKNTHCLSGDKDDWCETVLHSSCSDPTIRANCCKTCS